MELFQSKGDFMREDWYFDILTDAVLLRRIHPECREGQAVYIVASNKFPVEVDSIPLEDDCYYKDQNIESFLEILSSKINTHSVSGAE